jgi:hypothetical protein
MHAPGDDRFFAELRGCTAEPRTRVALERTFAAAQAKRVRRTRRQQPGD